MKELVTVCFVVLVASAGMAQADVISDSGTVSFTSDLEDPKVVELMSFDTTADLCPLGLDTVLQSVTVTFSFDGGADLAGDNDDPFQSADMNGRVIRTWTATGPGVAAFGTETVTTAIIPLDPDDGDLGIFDPNPPDGHDFGTVGFSGEGGGIYSPTPALYETAGPGTVQFAVNPEAMVNDLQFGITPDAWQLEVQNPFMDVHVEVVYDYECVPEPSTFVLAGFGLLGLLACAWRSRKRV